MFVCASVCVFFLCVCVHVCVFVCVCVCLCVRNGFIEILFVHAFAHV